MTQALLAHAVWAAYHHRATVQRLGQAASTHLHQGLGVFLGSTPPGVFVGVIAMVMVPIMVPNW